jgi:hypothetical protein
MNFEIKKKPKTTQPAHLGPKTPQTLDYGARAPGKTQPPPLTALSPSPLSLSLLSLTLLSLCPLASRCSRRAPGRPTGAPTHAAAARPPPRRASLPGRGTARPPCAMPRASAQADHARAALRRAVDARANHAAR